MPIKPGSKAWVDGRVVRWEDATVHMATHSLHYGTAVIEGVRAYEAREALAVFRLSDHLTRLYESARILRMRIPLSTIELARGTKEILRANGLQPWYIRHIVFRGYGEMGMDVRNSPVSVAILLWRPRVGAGASSAGLRVMVSSWCRCSPKTLPPSAKAAAHYMTSVLARGDALDSGYDEAILLNDAGEVVEGSAENVFVVRNETLITPPVASGILPGITRDTVIRLAEDAGIPVRIERLLRSDLYTADEAFFTGTAVEIEPIASVDNIDIPRGPVATTLQREFSRVTRGDRVIADDWLDYVDESRDRVPL